MRNNNLLIGEEIYRTSNGTNIIYEASYKGDPAYALVYKPMRTKFEENKDGTYVFDHDTKIYRSIIKRIEMGRALTCDHKANGRGLLKFHPLSESQGAISFRLFLWAKYRKCRLKSVRKKICLEDESDVENRVYDFRSCNLYAPGEIRPITTNRTITVISRPTVPDEKYICIDIHGRENGKIEMIPYEPELYEMLASPGYCNIGYNKIDDRDRATVVVHFAHSKDGYVISNLAQFVLIYKEHFDSYRRQRGAVKRFIQDYDKLRKKHEGKHAGHVNASKWNNAFENLVFMDRTTDMEMSNYIKYFGDQYKVYTAVNERGEILIELQGAKCVPEFYKAKTPEAFLCWQNMIQGRYKLTEHLTHMTVVNEDGTISRTLTPRGMIAEGVVNGESSKGNEPEFWDWCDHRDALLSMPDEAFTECVEPEQVENGIPIMNLPMLLSRCFSL